MKVWHSHKIWEDVELLGLAIMSLFKEHFVSKHVVITGAGKGVGRALAVELHSLGAEVYAITRTQADLDSLIQECPGIHPIALDISKWELAREILVDKVPDTVDVLVNNAGVLCHKPILDVSPDDFDRVMNTNLKAVVNVTQVCVSKMIRSGTEGVVINVSSTTAVRPGAMFPIYSASKAALDSLTKTMAVEFGKHKIRVVGLNPCGIKTNISAQFENMDPADLKKLVAQYEGRYPLGQMILPMEQVVSTILFLASGLAKMMTGSSVVVDGGYCAT